MMSMSLLQRNRDGLHTARMAPSVGPMSQPDKEVPPGNVRYDLILCHTRGHEHAEGADKWGRKEPQHLRREDHGSHFSIVIRGRDVAPNRSPLPNRIAYVAAGRSLEKPHAHPEPSLASHCREAPAKEVE